MTRFVTPTALLGALLLLAVGLSPAASVTGEPDTIRVTGRLLVSMAEDGRAQYAIAVDDDLVPVRWSGEPLAESGDRVTADLLLPAGLAPGLPGSWLRSGTTLGDRALGLVDTRTDTLTVTGMTVHEASAPAAPGPVEHRVFVAAPSTLGSFPLSDAQMLARIERAAAFWEDEGDGAITDMVVPAQVVRYAPTVATDSNNCGLDWDFFEVMEETAAQFPAADFYGGTDLLVLLAPSSCTSTSAAGRALLGQDLANGGVQVSSVNDDFGVGTLGHEWGHNFGLTHANLGPCDDFNGCLGEYDNLYNVMGRGISLTDNRLTALSTAYRSILGILAPGEVLDVPFPESGGATTTTTTLAARTDETGRRAVRVVEPDTGEVVYVEYRSGTGQDALSAYARGATFRGIPFRAGVVMESVDESSAWLRLGPSSRAAMVGGQTWSNESGTLTISVGEVTASSAAVTVVATPGSAWSDVATVSIEGEPMVDRQLFAADSPPGDELAARRLQWYVDGVAVDGATGYSYDVRAGDVDRQVRVAVTDYGYGKRPRTTWSTAVTIQPGTLFAYDPPTVRGVAEVGRTLTTNGAIWDDPRFSGPTSTSLQWRSGGVAVPGATGDSYVVRPEDVGQRITVADTGTRLGYTTLTLVSDPTAVVAAPPFPSPPTPTVAGEARVGQPLTADPGTWPAGTDLQLQWLSGGSAVPGATGSEYTPRAGDVGRRVSVRVTATNPAYRTTNRTSESTDAVLRGRLSAGTPTISGAARVGRTLTADPGSWTPGTRFAYQWLADGRALRGATGRRLVLVRAHRGTRISVKVTGRLDGYTTRSATSEPTARVRR